MSRYFLGIDGGQSSTTALIGDESGRVIGMGRGGPCNHTAAAEGRTRFMSAIQTCLQQACAEAGLDPVAARFEAACLGFSGGPADKDALVREMVRAERIAVTHDALIALSGAMGGAPGVIVIAGTGSMAFGGNASGRTARVGGWGYVFGDEGSGFDITRQAVRAALRCEEGWGPFTLLHSMLLHATASSDANDLLHRFYTPEFPRSKIAALAKLVDEAAQQGDAVAHELLEGAAQDLASMARAVGDQLFEHGENVAIAHIGGVFRSSAVLQHFREILRDKLVVAPIHSPAGGALIEAYRLAGVSCKLSQLPVMEK